MKLYALLQDNEILGMYHMEQEAKDQLQRRAIDEGYYLNNSSKYGPRVQEVETDSEVKKRYTINEREEILEDDHDIGYDTDDFWNFIGGLDNKT